MIQIATLETDKAERLMKALCNHFARKTTARYESDKGYIEFGDAKCEITVTPNAMEFRADATLMKVWSTLNGLLAITCSASYLMKAFKSTGEIQFKFIRLDQAL